MSSADAEVHGENPVSEPAVVEAPAVQAPAAGVLRSGVDTDRLQFAKDAYKEVLDATKHQDERIGRFLTAIAFLVSAAIALSTSKRVVGVRFLTENGSRTKPIPFIAYALGAFIVFALLSVSWFILSLATQLTLPGGTSKRPSFMYFRSIAQYERVAWRKEWDTVEISSQTYDRYLDEIHNLALRANVKYERFREATAIFIVALVALVSSAPLMIDSLVNGVGVSDSLLPLQWNQSRAFGLAIVLSISAFAISYHSWQQARTMNPKDVRRHRILLVQMIVHPLFVLSLASGARPRSWIEIVVVVVAGFASSIPLIWQMLAEREWEFSAVLLVTFHIAVVVLAIVSTAVSLDYLRILVAVVAVALLEVPSFGRTVAKAPVVAGHP